MKKIVIYGVNKQAQQLFYYLTQEGCTVDGFCVDCDYYKESSFLGKPVVKLEDITNEFPASKYDILLSFGYKNMVANRKEKYDICYNLGYDMPSFISKDAKVYSDKIGRGVIIYPNVTIEPFVSIGDGCFIEASCTIAHHSTIGEFNFWAPGVTTGGGITVGNNCFFGVASSIVSGRNIANKTLVGAGVCVLSDTKEGTVLRHSDDILLSGAPENYV